MYQANIIKKIIALTSALFFLFVNTTVAIAANTNNVKSASNKSSSAVTDEEIYYLLNRISFGVRPGDIESVKAIGIKAFIEEQLNPETIPESQSVTDFIKDDDALTMSPIALYRSFGPPAVKAAMAKAGSDSPDDKKEAQKEIHKLAHEVFKDNAQLRVLRALYSPRQLQEVMTDFWFNHFNISADKGLDRILVGNYENVAIRPYTMGKFRDLLGATCHHAAMLFYLDNAENSIAKTDKNGKKYGGLNENYARELMELHTLGVDGGYTQDDVIQLAKILTGLGLPPQGRRAFAAGIDENTGTYFNEQRHDFSDKILLGQTIKGSGEQEIEQALDILASNPATARHISYQLAQYFVADKPPSSLVRKLTNRYMQSGGNIKAMLADLFTSNEFWDPQYRQAKYKNPFRYAVSVLRSTNAQPDNYDRVIDFLRQQGMPLYGCLTPDGYKNTEDAWLNPDTLLKRIGFATGIASGSMKQLCPQPPNYNDLSTTFGDKLSVNTQHVISKAPDKLKVALLLGSPDFMRY